MEFEIAPIGGVIVVSLPTRVDLGNVARFAEALRKALIVAERGVIVDCAQAHLIDSTALGALVKVRRELQDRAHRLVLARVRDEVQQVLRITKLDAVFAHFTDIDTAVRTLSSSRVG